MSITQGLHRAVLATPEQTATHFGDRVRTFTEQASRVARLAAGLRGRLGVGDGDRVAILALNSDRYIELLLATSWGGAVFSPLNVRWSLDELEYGLRDSGGRVLAVDDHFVPAARALRDRCPGLQLIHLGDAECPEGAVTHEHLIDSHPEIPDRDVPETEPAGLFYTGGTTGASRGVLLSHENLVVSAIGSLATGDILRPGPILHVAPLFHLAGIWPWLIQTIRGGTHHVLPAFDPAAICQTVRTRHIVNIFLVPTMVQRLAEHLAATQTDLPSLQRLLYAGSPIPEAVLDLVESLLPGAGLCQIYGMTELAPVATVLLPEDHVDRRRRSAGRAAAHTRVRVVDLDGHDCTPRTVGEIALSGRNVMLCYLGRPEETTAAVRDGWMYTGDAGYLEDGFVYVVDRLKDMIVSGGENVYSAEVENALAGHPDIESCAVIGLPDPTWGERVHAVVVPRAGATPELSTIRSHVAQRIAGYKAPRTLSVVEALPISAAGKVLKRELRAIFSPTATTQTNSHTPSASG